MNAARKPKPFRLTAPVPKEYAVHTGIVQMLRKWARPEVLYLHIPNQSIGGPRRGAFLKRMGRRAGAADLLIVDGGQSTFVEIKRPKGERRATQKAFQVDAETAGATYYLVDSVDAAAQLFNDLGILRRRLLVASNRRLYDGAIPDLMVTA